MRRILRVVLLALLFPSFALAAFPGQNGPIVYVDGCDLFHDPHLMSINPDGSDKREIVAAPALSPQFSPDGKYIVYHYASDPRIPGPIKVVTRNGLSPTTIGWGRAPSWSPDGKYVVVDDDHYDETLLTTSSLYTINVATGERKQITQPAQVREYSEQASWSPKGDQIVYYHSYYVQAQAGGAKTEHIDLFGVTPSGGTPLRLTDLGTADNGLDYNPDWHPSGSHILFDRGLLGSDTGDGVYTLVPGAEPVLLIDRRDVTPYPDLQGTMDPAYSPDGKWIAIAYLGANKQYQLGKVSLSGDDRFQLTSDAEHVCGMTWGRALPAVLTAGASSFSSRVEIDEEFSVAVAVRNEGDLTINDVTPNGPLQVEAVDSLLRADLVELVSGPTPSVITELPGGEQKQFDYRFKAKQEGRVRFVFPGAYGTSTDGNKVATDKNTEIATSPVRIKNKYVIDLEFDAYTMPGDSSKQSVTSAKITLKDKNDEPAPDQTVNVGNPFWRNFGRRPRVIFCDSDGRRVYPGEDESSATAFSKTTDSAGEIVFSVWGGTDVGAGSTGSGHIGLGNLITWASLPEFDAGEYDNDSVDIQGDPQTSVPTDLGQKFSEIIRAGSVNLGNLGVLAAIGVRGKLPQVQIGVLNWLLELRVGSDYLKQVDFGPIRSVNGQHAGIIFYPKNNPWPLIDHLEDGAALPEGYATLVLPFNPVLLLGEVEVEFDRMESLSTWETQPPPDPILHTPGQGEARGQAVPGLYGSAGCGSYYFGYRYPPAASEVDYYAQFTECLGGNTDQMAAQAHSPVTMLFTDSEGKRAGIAAGGEFLTEIPGSVVIRPLGKNPSVLSVPVGEYQAELTGIGQGPVTLIFVTPEAERPKMQVFNFEAKKKGQGQLTFSAQGADSSFKFSGKRVGAAKGLAFRLSGVPKKLRANKAKAASITVKNQFGAAMRGVSVQLDAKDYLVQGVTNSAGVAVLNVLPPAKGVKKLTLTVSAANYITYKKKIVVIRRGSRK